MTLTKYEKETIILFNEGEDTAHIQTYNAGLRKRLAAYRNGRPLLHGQGCQRRTVLSSGSLS